MNQHVDSSEPMVEVKNLSVDYADKRVLNDINLTVKSGEIMAIMGSSGAGKSTLLRQMLGLNKPQRGTVHLLGQNITEMSKKDLYSLRKNIGVAFQNGALLTSLSVGENIELPLREHSRLDESTIRIVSRLKLEMVNLSGCEHLMPSQLSGGMLKRAALARAVAMDPKLLFFDEPSSGLDPISTVELDKMIVCLRQAMDMTIVIITHEINSALKIADRVTLLSAGKVIFSDTVKVLEASNDSYIQDFMNHRSRDIPVDGEAYIRRLTGDG